MTTSDYMSDVVVEIAFDSGFATPEGARTWTDVSEWVELAENISITYGRQDERSQAEANTLSLTLDNSDGRFTPGLASSPYYPNVKLYRPIRVTATPSGGVPSVRFTGYINDWPTEWPGSDAYATAPLSAVSRLSRLGLSPNPRSALEQEILALGPELYYTLGDPENTTVAEESSGNGHPGLTTRAVVFGSAPGPPLDSLTAAIFTLTPISSFAVVRLPAPITSGDFTIGAFFSRDPAVAYIAQETILRLAVGKGAVGNDYVNIEIEVGGNLRVTGVQSGVAVANSLGINVADNQTHHVMFACESGTWFIYLDGSVVGIFFEAGITASYLAVGSSFAGVVAHAVVFDRRITTPEVQRIYIAGMLGNAGDPSATRLERYASWVGIPAAEIETGGLTQTNVAVETGTANVIDLMRQIEVTESAVLYDNREGHLSLVSETVRYAAPATIALDMAEQQVEADFSPRHDPSSILNDIAVVTLDGTSSARLVDTASRDDYGVASDSREITSTDPRLPFQLASWLLYRYAEPHSRVPNVTVDLTAQVGSTPSPDDVLAADIHSLISIDNQPAQAEQTLGYYFVEGYSEVIGVHSHVISFNVSPGEPLSQVLILDDPARGLLDTNLLGL